MSEKKAKNLNIVEKDLPDDKMLDKQFNQIVEVSKKYVDIQNIDKERDLYFGFVLYNNQFNYKDEHSLTGSVGVGVDNYWYVDIEDIDDKGFYTGFSYHLNDKKEYKEAKEKYNLIVDFAEMIDLINKLNYEIKR